MKQGVPEEQVEFISWSQGPEGREICYVFFTPVCVNSRSGKEDLYCTCSEEKYKFVCIGVNLKI